jgi:hypothetical protein
MEGEVAARVEAFANAWDETQIPEFRCVLVALVSWLPECLSSAAAKA